VNHVGRSFNADSHQRVFNLTWYCIFIGLTENLDNARLADEEFGRKKEESEAETLTA
jgi:hypothetical protein